jgi:hypothetical protein
MGLNLKKTTTIFIISSFVSIITIGYLGLAYNKQNRPSNIPYELFPVFIPILYGIFGLVNYYAIIKYGTNCSFFVGMLFGLILSLIGRFGLNLPKLLFNFTETTQYKVHIYAIFIYASIFQFIITPLTNYIIH